MTIEELQKRKVEIEAQVAALLTEFSREIGAQIRDVYFRGGTTEFTQHGPITASCTVRVSIDL